MICVEVVSTVIGDPERDVGEIMRTYLTDTPPVEEGGSHSRVIMEELGWFRMEDTIGLRGGEGGSVGALITCSTMFCSEQRTHQPQ